MENLTSQSSRMQTRPRWVIWDWCKVLVKTLFKFLRKIAGALRKPLHLRALVYIWLDGSGQWWVVVCNLFILWCELRILGMYSLKLAMKTSWDVDITLIWKWMLGMNESFFGAIDLKCILLQANNCRIWKLYASRIPSVLLQQDMCSL